MKQKWPNRTIAVVAGALLVLFGLPFVTEHDRPPEAPVVPVEKAVPVEPETPDTPETAAVSPVVGTPAAPEPGRPEPVKVRTREITASRGDTLTKLLLRAGLDTGEAHGVVTALKPVYDLTRMQVGQTFILTMIDESVHGQGARDQADMQASATAVPLPGLASLSFQPTVDQEIRLHRKTDGGYSTEIIDLELLRQDMLMESSISVSLYQAATGLGMPYAVLDQLIRIFSFDVDFQRGIQPGDSFAVLYDSWHNAEGEPVRDGNIVWASMTLSGDTLAYIRHDDDDGYSDYYDRRGKNNRTALMRTPINGARLSSPFGKRKHPILGYTRMHQGVDFPARKGVPIMAAGDGVIEAIGRNGGYGKYIRIRHDSEYKTAYAHMSRYGKGLKRGSRVRQGETIGYVGSTGLSTGPHLHFEVIYKGRKTDPQTVRLPRTKRLKGDALEALTARWSRLDDRLAAARANGTYVKGDERHG